MKPALIPGKKISGKMIILILLISCNIFSQTRTFTAAQNNNWTNGSNWVPNGVPGSTDTLIIPAGKTIIVNATGTCASIVFTAGPSASIMNVLFFRGLTVSGTVLFNNNTIIDIDPLSAFTIGGSLIINDTVTVKSVFGILELQNGIINNGLLTTDGYLSYQFTTNNQSISENDIVLSGNVNVSDSISVLNNTNLTINGNLTGSNNLSVFINGEDAALNISGSLMSTGSLNCSAMGNTINYNGDNQSVKEADYYNLFLSGTGTKTLPASASAFNINGNLIIGAGTTLNGNDRLINIEGNWTNDGNFTNSNSVSFTGTAVQSIDGDVALSVDSLIIDNPAGIILANSLMVSELLHLINGKVTTSSDYLLTISAGGSILGGNVSSFLNGPLARVKNTTAQQTMFYPIGKGNNYRPIELVVTHSTSTGSTYTAEVFNNAPAARTLPGTLGSVSGIRYWKVTKTGPAALSEAYITLNYGIDDGVTSPEDLRIAKSSGSVWEDIGGAGSSTPEGSIVSSQFTSFSDFVLANRYGGINPLPVELSAFTALSKTSEVLLKWTTETEIQNYGFEIEKSKKTESIWENIGFVKGSGNSNSPKEYSFIDHNVSSGNYLYRLKQVDLGGNFQYSGEVEVSIENIAESYVLEQNYPNPFNPSTWIKFAVNETSPVSVKVYDVLGKEVETLFNETAESGKYYSLEFNGSNYSSGVYYYAITGNNYGAVKKMILIK